MSTNDNVELGKDAIAAGLKAAGEMYGPDAAVRLARPVIQQAVKKAYVGTLQKEVARGAIEGVGFRATAAAAGKAATGMSIAQKAAGPILGIVVSPLAELGKVAYESVVKGEVRTAEDYKEAAKRGTASGAAGAAASLGTAAIVGLVCAPAAPIVALAAAVFASGYVDNQMKDS